MGARKRPSARCDGDVARKEETTLETEPVGDQSMENRENPPTTPTKQPKAPKKRTKKTQPDNADTGDNADTADNADQKDKEQQPRKRRTKKMQPDNADTANADTASNADQKDVEQQPRKRRTKKTQPDNADTANADTASNADQKDVEQQPRKRRTKKTQPDNADTANADTASNADQKDVEEQPSRHKSEPSGSNGDPAPKEAITPTSAAPAKRPASARATTKKDTDDSAGAAAKGRATAKKKSKAKKTDTKEAAGGETNPFDMPPDEGQQRLSSFFSSKETEDNEHPDKEGQGDDGANQETNEAVQKVDEGNTEGEGQDSNSKDDGSSTSSSSTKQSHVPLLGEFEDESNVMSGSPCVVQPDQIRSRIQMFSFPTRHVQRLKKHWGSNTVMNLDANLADATVVSLYSGLGGAEIASKLLAHAVSSTLTQSNPDKQRVQPLVPEFLLACDHSNDCQKVLRSHHDTCSSN